MKRNAYLRALDDVEAAITDGPHHMEHDNDSVYSVVVMDRETVFAIVRKLRLAAIRQEG